MIKRLAQFTRRFHANESGKMSVEMILLIALIALPIILLLIAFRGKIIGYFQGQQSQLQDPGQQQLQ